VKISDWFKSPEQIVTSYFAAGMIQAEFEQQFDDTEEGGTFTVKAPAPLLFRDVLKRGGYRGDIVGYVIRKRKP